MQQKLISSLTGDLQSPHRGQSSDELRYSLKLKLSGILLASPCQGLCAEMSFGSAPTLSSLLHVRLISPIP